MPLIRAPPRLPHREGTTLIVCSALNCPTVSCRQALTVCPRPARLALKRRRCNCAVAKNCALAAPQRQHSLHKIELGYQTDFGDQYSLLEIIGKGNFGTVWLAACRHDPSLHVAVKVVPKSRADRAHEDSLSCIRREVATWGILSGASRYVNQLLGLYEDSSSVYLVQQLCSGGDLSSALKDGPLPESCCAAIMWCVLSAIRDCHSHRVALVDVKPQNFLLTRAASAPGHGGAASVVRSLRLQDQVAGGGANGPALVACDFGCSLSYSELMRGTRRAGSPVFFAPEQFTSTYGLGVDVWAAGVMLYLLLSGCYPFWDCKREEVEAKLPAYQVMLAVCSAPICCSGPEWRGLSREARDLVSSMLDRNPGTRISAEQALQHPWFARWLRHEAAEQTAAATGTAAASCQGVRRRRAQTAAAAPSEQLPREVLPQPQEQQQQQQHLELVANAETGRMASGGLGTPGTGIAAANAAAAGILADAVAAEDAQVVIPSVACCRKGRLQCCGTAPASSSNNIVPMQMPWAAQVGAPESSTGDATAAPVPVVVSDGSATPAATREGADATAMPAESLGTGTVTGMAT